MSEDELVKMVDELKALDGEDDMDEFVHDAFAEMASVANNEGTHAQIAQLQFLGYTKDAIANEVRSMIRERKVLIEFMERMALNEAV